MSWGHNNSPYMMYLSRMCAQTARDQGKKLKQQWRPKMIQTVNVLQMSWAFGDE